uniref:Muscarinic acetylcholine receptor n=1 Tax=Astatotilapia calliptera TaxID=8154 RepID=A0AAX7UU92_ASTCA
CETHGVGTGSPYKALEMFFIAMVTGSLSFVTVTGNILVMLSIKVNRHLQTVNNYFLFSLACADLIIGVFSMNLYTVYIIVGYWPLGPVVCDLWLALDYVVSNASVMNLLIISFDRYFCVTKPLTYPTRRTTKMAGLMIAAAWILSFILWAPAILFWQFIVGQRTVPPGECYIQFLSNPAVTFGTAIAAFYLPVIIMTVLYIHISLASRSRRRCTHDHTPQGGTAPRPRWCFPFPCGGGKQTTPTPQQQEGSTLQTAVGRPTPPPKKTPNLPPPAHCSVDACVTKTIFAILLAFIITWTPYNVMVLISTFCQSCVPDTVWAIGYWLCYVNSTINPACYALCNATFKKTFKNLLLCQYKNIGTR